MNKTKANLSYQIFYYLKYELINFIVTSLANFLNELEVFNLTYSVNDLRFSNLIQI